MRPGHQRHRRARTPKGRRKEKQFWHSKSPRTYLKKVLKEKILDSRVEFLLRELLGIAKECQDLLVDLVKRKREIVEENAPRVNTVLMNDTEVEE